MTIELRRRELFAAMAAAGVATFPGRALAQGLDRGFTHNVASGEPGADSVMLWTRFLPSDRAEAGLLIDVAEDAGFTRIVRRAETVASPDADFCARARIDGLAPGKWYFYRFRTRLGEESPVGRTRTLPTGRTAAFRMAVFSCSNLPFGMFNAYAHAAARDDIDLVVHLGDYIYEYPRGTYPSAREALAGRIIDPAHEIVSLADYHARYSSYRRDRDLQMLHQRFPMISIWDDHEITNDAWKGGAQNHQPDEGPWEVRKAAAKSAYWNWLPMAEDPYKVYEIGDLASLIRLDTRLEGRDQQLSVADALKLADDPAKALVQFRDTVYADPARHILGERQEAWVAEAFGASVKAGKRWQVVAQQLLAGISQTPPNAELAWLGGTPPDFVRQRFEAGMLAAKVGLPNNFDAWGGYPAARSRYLKSAQAAGANLVQLAGDSHNAWAFELTEGGSRAGVEFGVHGTTSPGLENFLRGIDPKALAEALVGANPDLKWCDTKHRGYMTVSLTEDAAQCDWHFLDTIRERSMTLAGSKTARVVRGTNRVELV